VVDAREASPHRTPARHKYGDERSFFADAQKEAPAFCQISSVVICPRTPAREFQTAALSENKTEGPFRRGRSRHVPFFVCVACAFYRSSPPCVPRPAPCVCRRFRGTPHSGSWGTLSVRFVPNWPLIPFLRRIGVPPFFVANAGPRFRYQQRYT